MTGEAEFDEVERAMLACLDAAGPEHVQALDRACAEHPELSDDLRERFEVLRRNGFVAAAPAVDEDPVTVTTPPPRLAASELPNSIGAFRILEILGEGGMGTVYLAEQREPIRRRVALKVIKAGLDSGHVLARFEAERQALALMNHANVARVLEAGEADGCPYFVMDYVDGQPITQHCDTHRLGLEERLRLFLQVCEGVHHAHEKGVIHRDIKPNNVLVSHDGDHVVPKIIDFGLAKATEVRLTERTLYTETGAIVGTPEYMSPEQAQSTGPVDRRTDIYSLGVLLYELLVGALPFDAVALRSGGYLELQRKICEEEPPTPSTRLSGLGESSQDAATARGTHPRALARRIRGDLDWITMKALEKTPQRRYHTAEELHLDLTRYLEDRLPRAASRSGRIRGIVRRIGYRMRRHKTPLLAAAALVVGIGATFWMMSGENDVKLLEFPVVRNTSVSLRTQASASLTALLLAVLEDEDQNQFVLPLRLAKSGAPAPKEGWSVETEGEDRLTGHAPEGRSLEDADFPARNLRIVYVEGADRAAAMTKAWDRLLEECRGGPGVLRGEAERILREAGATGKGKGDAEGAEFVTPERVLEDDWKQDGAGGLSIDLGTGKETRK